MTSINGDEALSRLFRYDSEMLSADQAITPESLIGRDVKVLLSDGRGAWRPVRTESRACSTSPSALAARMRRRDFTVGTRRFQGISFAKASKRRQVAIKDGISESGIMLGPSEGA